MEKKNIFNILILLLSFVVVVSFPINLLTNDIYIQQYVQIGLRAVYLVFSILYIKLAKVGHSYTGKTRWSNILILLPLFIIAVCNLFYVAVIVKTPITNIFQKIGKAFSTTPTYEILIFVYVILTAVCEEIVFRFALERSLTMSHKMVRILITAGVFAVCHFLNVFSVVDLSSFGTQILKALTQMAYTFFIGIVLGVLYEYTNSIFVPITFHIIYNLCNDTIYNAISSGTPGWPYYINAICFAAFGVAYILIFYFLILKRDNR